jgi:two-component system cell cycle sensor histidine kinase/response regulator CckA
MIRRRIADPRASDADRLAAILTGAHDAIIASDTDGVITDWNPAAERLYAYTAEQAIGRPVAMLVPPERRGEELQVRDAVRRGELVDRQVTERLRADGTRVRVSLTVSPVRAENGTIAGASAIHRLAEPEASRLAALVEHSAYALYATDARGALTDWSPGAERLLGWPSAEILGREESLLVPVGREREAAALLAGILRAEVVTELETVRLRKDGAEVPVAISASPVVDAGEIVGMAVIARDRTRPLQAEQALARSEARFRTLVEAAPDPILGVADDGRIVFASSRIREVLGYTPEELIGRPIELLVPERLHGAHVAHRAQFVAEPATRPMGAGRELFARRKDGTEVPVEISLGHTAHEGEGITSAILVDVSARRAADADRALLASIVQSSGDAIVSAGRDGIMLSWNRAAEEMFGVSATDAVGRSMDELIPAMDQTDARWRMVTQLFEEGRTFRYEARRQGTGGQPILLSVTMSPVRDASGAVVAGCAICRDVTAQRDTEARTRQLAAIVESSLDPIFAVDLDDIVISWNAAAERLYRIPASEALGRHIDAVLPDPHGDRAALRRRVAAGETVFDYQASRRLGDGRRVDLSITTFPLRDDAGAVVASASIIRDVTERKRLEDRLHQSQRIEAVGRLAGGVAHDFNNLLTVITGYGAIAQTHIGEGPGAEELDEVQRAAARASELTGRLLDFSRQRAIDPVRLDLAAATRDIVPMLERLIGEDIQIIVEAGDDVPAVLADPGQIEQVILNLAVNARDAMPQGGTLTVQTHAADLREGRADAPQGLAPGRYACLTVSDTGQGIEPEIAEHLFEPFFTTKETGKGTGLGLATVHGIVGQAGGDVSVSSRPGHGAAFTVYLPAIDAEASSRSARPVASPERLDGNETVLLAEDEQTLAYLIERILSAAGYRVLTASAPEDALRIAEHEHGAIDVLVTDVIMPGLTGPQLAERLTERHGPLPTLFLSGYTADIIRDRGRLPSGSAFLEKPFDPLTLLASLRALLEREPQA